ncbi:hypothetical protein MA16_Dca008867 [Dendrobium catenatum]|uniref:Uncharacterized protein n=1 Tax=Dendrobium catenatum TaxID=906689 RepID=A0A2I0VUH7_9ASPA|nr:hypothetical protein MA16_Dca008867 [Dendrobium catenatum]
MSKPLKDVYELIEKMDTNNFWWPSDRVNPKRVSRVYEFDLLFILFTQVFIISKMMDIIGVSLE